MNRVAFEMSGFQERWRTIIFRPGWNYMWWSDCLRSTRLLQGVFTFNFLDSEIR